MHKVIDNLFFKKKSYGIRLSAMCIYFWKYIFIEMFEDYWNYNYHTHSLNIWKAVNRRIAVVKKAEQQQIEGNLILQIL